MYRLTTTITNNTALNLLPEVAFNPGGTLFAVTHQQTNEVVVFDARTRSVLRVYQNPAARLDNPHGILLTDKHMVVSNTHGLLQPSSFTIYTLNDSSGKPVMSYTTPYQHLREAHSLDLHNNILVATYSQSTHGPGAVVTYHFDDEEGLIDGPICMRESCFTPYGEPKGVAFSGDGTRVFFTYSTEKRMAGLSKYSRRLRAVRNAWQERGVAEFLRYLQSKSARRINAMRAPKSELHNGIAIFNISERGELAEKPCRVLKRELFCRLENIAIVGDTVLLTDTINGKVFIHDLAKDPQLETPVYTITENVTLPHGAKLSPDLSMLVVTNYGIKVSNQIIYWKVPARDSKNSIVVYDFQASLA